MAELAVIGMGRFGRAVVRNLTLAGQDVLAVDRDADRLQEIASEAAATLCLDSTDEEALKGSVSLARMGTVVVTIGSRAMEASLLTVAVLKELHVPRIVVRVFDDRHERLVRRLGAHEVLNPEDDMGRRLALRLAHPGIDDRLVLGDSMVAEVDVPQTFVDATLGELADRFGVAVLAVRRRRELLSNPPPEELLQGGDRLLLLGSSDALESVEALV